LWPGSRSLASLAGYGLFQNSPPDTVAFVLAFAAGVWMMQAARLS
jgi:hypothetical protein